LLTASTTALHFKNISSDGGHLNSRRRIRNSSTVGAFSKRALTENFSIFKTLHCGAKPAVQPNICPSLEGTEIARQVVSWQIKTPR
jgi:hypothetical protein